MAVLKGMVFSLTYLIKVFAQSEGKGGGVVKKKLTKEIQLKFFMVKLL